MKNRNGSDDKRPDPKPRKHAALWQAYQWWSEFSDMRKRHLLRISSAEHGKSNMSAQIERDFMEIYHLDAIVDPKNASERPMSPETMMLAEGEKLGAVWEWATSIKGLAAGGLAAQLFAQIDDVGKFATVSKLWRFAGYAVIDGAIDRNQKGEKSHYNSTLKSLVYLIVDQFIRQKTPVYYDLYLDEKARQRRLHPKAICRECGAECIEKVNGDGHTVYRCPENGKHFALFTDGHLHSRAMRKTGKIFLQHLWVMWRESEGLPVTGPYVQDVMGHEHIIATTRV